MTDLKEHVAVITGASGGLGTWVTQAFVNAGARIIGIARAAAPAQGLFTGVGADLTSAEGARLAIDEAWSIHGRIDSLIHLVGSFAGGASVAESDPSTFSGMFDVNVRSAFYVMRAVLPHMREAYRGTLVMTGSKAAIEPSPGAGLYAASKAALLSLTRTVAAENSNRGITANIVLPGTMDTPANREAMPGADFSSWVRPADVAALIVHLVSPAGAAINGAAIPVFGARR